SAFFPSTIKILALFIGLLTRNQLFFNEDSPNGTRENGLPSVLDFDYTPILINYLKKSAKF
ncbi:MAG TPA: hypothetical protein VGK00_05685, partial [Anaerolineales bacterium]